MDWFYAFCFCAICLTNSQLIICVRETIDLKEGSGKIYTNPIENSSPLESLGTSIKVALLKD